MRQKYPGRRLLVVSNTAGAASWDKGLKIAEEVHSKTGIHVLSHSVKKPGCGEEIMNYFKQHPETGVTSPAQIAVVGDRLTTDMFLANKMGGFGFWIRDGVIPMKEKNFVSIPQKQHHFRTCLMMYSFQESSVLWPHSCFDEVSHLRSQSAHSRSLEGPF